MSCRLNRLMSLRRRVHTSAVSGFTAAAAESYDKGRPEYTDEALRQILRILRKSGPAQDITTSSSYKIIELGAGTGKFTQSFQRYSANMHNAKIRYIATEPSAGFRAKLVEKQLPGIIVEDGLGSKIPSKDGKTHMVVVAQAYHWMDTQETLDEVHRVLHPHGSFVMLWNSYDYRNADWLRQIDEKILVPSYGTHTPRQQSENWRQSFFTARARTQFTPLHGWFSPYTHDGDRNLIVNRVLSTSVVAKKDPEEKEKIISILNHILDTHPQLESARQTNRYQIPYVTHVAWVFKQ